MSISFTQALIVGGAGIGGVVGFAYGGQSIRTRAVTGTIGAIAGGLIGYGITFMPGLINQNLNQKVASDTNNATNSQAGSPTVPTPQTIAANGLGAADYLDVPTVAVQGTGAAILVGSTNSQAALSMNIVNGSGFSVYSKQGTGFISVNVDSTGISTGTWTVNMIDSTDGVAKSAVLNYVPATSDSIANIAAEIEQGALNIFHLATQPLTGLL